MLPSYIQGMESRELTADGTEAGEPGEPPDPISWKATLGIIGIFCVGVTLTQLVVMGALYVGQGLVP